MLGVATVLLLLAPGGLYLLPSPWNIGYRYGQIALWIADAAFLAWLGWRGAASVPARADPVRA